MTLKELLFGHDSSEEPKNPLDAVKHNLRKAESSLAKADSERFFALANKDNKANMHNARADAEYTKANKAAERAKQILKTKGIQDTSLEKRIDTVLQKC